MLATTIVRFSDHELVQTTVAAIAVILLLCSLSFGQNAEDTTQPTNCIPVAQNPSLATSKSVQSSGSAIPNGQIAKSRGEFVVAPIPMSSPAVGSGLIAGFGYIFTLSKNDKVSPPSTIGAAGLITDNGSRAFAVGGQLFIKQDTYRITAAFFQGNLDYNLYGIGAAAGNADVKLPLKQDGAALLVEVLRRVKWKFFLGPRVLTGHSIITLRPGGSAMVPNVPDVGLRTALTSLGFSIKRDTRPNRFYASSGTVFELTSDFFANGLGSKYSFQSYRTTFNKYGSLSKNQVLAYNAYFCATGGQAPFYGNCIYGIRNELRGYEAGRYLDRYMVATQVEYRLVLPKRFGLVGFGGIGGVAPGGREFFRSDAFLPAGGAGVRFMLSKTYHVNLRADLAAGKNEHTFSMGVSEAF